MPDYLRRSHDASRRDHIIKPAEGIQRNTARTSALLSKHKGWITVDDENPNRSQAPEHFKQTQAAQQDKLRPAWLITSYSSVQICENGKVKTSALATPNPISPMGRTQTALIRKD
jgi:hypothetical protein